MNKLAKEISDKINTKDKEVLLHCLVIINEHLNKENQRGISSTNKLNSMLTLMGVGSALLFFFGNFLFSNNEVQNDIMIKIFFLFAATFLIKSIYYSIKTMSVQKVNRLNPDLIFDIQNKNFIESIRYEIVWKIWEYKQLLPFHTSKLFLINRCQRNFFITVLIILIIATLLPFNIQQLSDIPLTFKYVSYVIFIFIFLFGDAIMDRLGFWHYQ